MKTVKFLISILLATLCNGVFASDLTQTELQREYLVFGTLVLDAAQTLDIKNHPELHEQNPILGNHPSDTKVIAYFAAAGYAHYSITKALPTEYRATWQYGWAALELATIIRNRQLNLRFNF
jgi:lipid II:glycine glycyltransferase (peptidoglycan interpeptide bridge formation enzyme)